MNVIARFGFRVGPCVALAALLTGCGRTEPPQFNLNMVAIAEKQIAPEQQQEVANILDAMFGTPDEPFVLPEMGLDLAKLQMAAGPVKSDEFGRETGLYRRHCAHCHGTTGDGLGPTALILNPYPRDYRPGIFKFKSTSLAGKPTDHDLETILRNGIPGTAMPSFDLLPDAQVKSLVEYVKYLSLRGQTETRIEDALTELSEGEKLPVTRAALVEEILQPLAESWTNAAESIVLTDGENAKPEGDALASIHAGRELFYSTKANCVKCHGASAQGDGQTNDFDYWSKAVTEATKNLNGEIATLDSSNEMSAEERAAMKQHVAALSAALKSDSLPPRNAIPRNLRQGIYRGGRRPVDIYRRLYTGIYGTPMPGVGPASPGAQGTLTSNEIWNLVDYVLSLPYEPQSQPGREQRSVSKARL